jgi:hypothetical protein
MDAGILGGIIGTSVFCVCGSIFYFYDKLKKSDKPIQNNNIIIKDKHWKVNKLFDKPLKIKRFNGNRNLYT